MDVSVAQAKNKLPSLIRAVEEGESVVITRNGKPVAQLTARPPALRKVQFNTMKGRVKLGPGWDAAMDLDDFLAGRF